MQKNKIHRFTQAMRSRWLVSALAAGLPLLTLQGGIAAPPTFAQVPADVDWLFHVDLDALRDSTAFQQVFKTVVTEWKSLPTALARVQERFGIDPAKDLHGMTVFGPRPSQQSALVVMRADWAAETFRRKLALAPHHTATAEGPYEIHRFERQDSIPARPVAAALWKPGIIVFGQSVDAVRSGLEFLDGKHPDLSGRGLSDSSALAAEVPAGTILVVRMVHVGDRLPVESPLLKQTDQIDLVCGEKDGRCFVHGKLQAKSPEIALQVEQVAVGLLAAARLRLAGDADSLKLLDHAQIRLDHRTIELDFRAPAADVAQAAEKAMKTFSQPPPGANR
jgi:hypothetical protein